MFLFVVNLVFAVICGSMAHARGRSVAAGILGGLFFGIFSALYYLIAGDTVERRVEKEDAARAKLARKKYNEAQAHDNQGSSRHIGAVSTDHTAHASSRRTRL
jgi:hypothetical protein